MALDAMFGRALPRLAMKSADKFDPDRGVRFATYAVLRIRASIQEFVTRHFTECDAIGRRPGMRVD